MKASLSIRTEIALSKFLETVSQFDEQTETNRQILANDPDFTKENSFNLLDVDRKAYVSPGDLRGFLAKHFNHISEQEARLLVRSINPSSSERIY